MKAKYFKIQELVSKGVYNKYGEKAWRFLDPHLIKTLDDLREFFGKPIMVNDWLYGGQLEQRGLRANKDKILLNKKDYYISAHVLGRGADISVKGLSPREVYNKILENHEKFPYIKRMENIEDTPTWVHIDLLDTDKKGMCIFKP